MQLDQEWLNCKTGVAEFKCGDKIDGFGKIGSFYGKEF